MEKNPHYLIPFPHLPQRTSRFLRPKRLLPSRPLPIHRFHQWSDIRGVVLEQGRIEKLAERRSEDAKARC